MTTEITQIQTKRVRRLAVSLLVVLSGTAYFVWNRWLNSEEQRLVGTWNLIVELPDGPRQVDVWKFDKNRTGHQSSNSFYWRAHEPLCWSIEDGHLTVKRQLHLWNRFSWFLKMTYQRVRKILGLRSVTYLLMSPPQYRLDWKSNNEAYVTNLLTEKNRRPGSVYVPMRLVRIIPVSGK